MARLETGASRRLTKAMIDRAVFGEIGSKLNILWDHELPGFGLRLFPSGKKSFVLTYRIQNRKRIITLGRYGVITLEQARRAARITLGRIGQGIDPLEEKKLARQSETVGALCAIYMERHARPFKKTWKEDQSRIDKYILPRWKNHWVKAIQHPEVRTFRHELAANSIHEANKAIALVSKMWEFARDEGLIPRTADNPARGVEKYPVKKRSRWVTPEELPRLAEAINAYQNKYIRAGLWLLLLLGLRRSELLMAKWEYIDLDRRLLSLPDTKAGTPHYVPLEGMSLYILERLPRVEGNPYVLPGKRDGKPLVNISKAWSAIREDAGLKDVRIHDLRRTVGSWIVQRGGTLYLAQHVLGHKDSKTTEIYSRFAQDHLRLPLERHSEAIVSAAGQPPLIEMGSPVTIRSPERSDEKAVP